MAETALQETQNAPARAWVAGLLGWAVPGAGHLSLGRVVRGVLLGGAVWLMFFVGLWLGGHLYSMWSSTTGLLSYVFGFFDLGVGLVYMLCRVADIGVVDQAHLPTSEYGNIFLMVAGLLNFLLALDAFDIGAGRKS